MITQELLHEASSAIYITQETEVVEGSTEWLQFQQSTDPTTLGYTFLETVAQRQERIDKFLETYTEPY